MENQEQQKYRVTTMITDEERDYLRVLAWNNQRSMSGYLRYLLICELNKCYKQLQLSHPELIRERR
jgi:hypothetical protein